MTDITYAFKPVFVSDEPITALQVYNNKLYAAAGQHIYLIDDNLLDIKNVIPTKGGSAVNDRDASILKAEVDTIDKVVKLP